MGAGVFNLLLGLVGLVGGLSGRLALLGTNSSVALAVVGGLIAAYGAYQIIRSRRR